MFWPSTRRGSPNGRPSVSICLRLCLRSIASRGTKVANMTKLGRIVLAIYAAGSLVCFGQAAVVEQAGQLELKGQFKQAAGLLKTALQSKALPTDERKKLEFELDRLQRIRKDFPYTKDALFAELKNALKG